MHRGVLSCVTQLHRVSKNNNSQKIFVKKLKLCKFLSIHFCLYCCIENSYRGKPLSVEALKPNESLQWKIKYWKMKHGVEDTETSVDEIEEDVKLLPEARFVCPLTGKVMVDPVMTKVCI